MDGVFYAETIKTIDNLSASVSTLLDCSHCKGQTYAEL